MSRPRSVSIYDALLRIYPARFREAYASELRWVFQRQLEDARRRAGIWGIARIWMDVVPDLIVTAADQHVQEGSTMTSATMTKGLPVIGLIGGMWWAVLGALVAIEATGWFGRSGGNFDSSVILFMTIGAVCYAAGLIALSARPGRGWPTLARLMLLIPAVCAVYSLVIWLFPVSDDWMVRIAGLLTAPAAVTLAGVVLLIRSDARGLGLLLIAQGVTQLLFNTENWRALFLSVSGLIAILLMSQRFQSDTEPRPQAPVVS